MASGVNDKSMEEPTCNPVDHVVLPPEKSEAKSDRLDGLMELIAAAVAAQIDAQDNV